MRKTVTVMAAAIVVVFIPASTIAQNAADHKPKHKQYKLIDLGTFGGPNSIIFGATGPLNNSGMVTSCADKATADPFFPNNSPYFAGDPFVEDAFLWTGRALKDLGALPGGLGSCGQWISDNGEVVGASENGEFDAAAGFPSVMAVRWKHGSIQALGSFGGLESVAFAVNNAGQVTGGAANTIPDDNQGAIFSAGATQIHTFLWEKGAMQDLGTLGGPDSQGFYINKRGEIAGLSTTNNTPNQTTGIPTVDPFVWKDGRMIDLGTLGGTFGAPGAISNGGQIVGNSNISGDVVTHAFVWERNHMIDLGTLGGDNSFGNWINNAGQAVGTSDLPDGSHHAFVWRKGVIRDLGAVGSDNCSNGVGINSAGVATGTSTDCQGNVLHVFLWQNGSIVNLSALIQPGSDITFYDPVMINDRGEIAGNGITSDGNNHAVLLVPVGDCDYECEGRAAVPPAGNSSLSGLGRIEEKTSPMNAARRRRHLR
jgi:probable HAF family extracellular repeat protein